MEEIAAEVAKGQSEEEVEVSFESPEDAGDVQGRAVTSVTVTYIVIIIVSHVGFPSVIVAVSIIPEAVGVADVELSTTAEVQSSAAVATAILGGAEAGALA